MICLDTRTLEIMTFPFNLSLSRVKLSTFLLSTTFIILTNFNHTKLNICHRFFCMKPYKCVIYINFLYLFFVSVELFLASFENYFFDSDFGVPFCLTNERQAFSHLL